MNEEIHPIHSYPMKVLKETNFVATEKSQTSVDWFEMSENFEIAAT
jgi:hypothetical protein